MTTPTVEEIVDEFRELGGAFAERYTDQKLQRKPKYQEEGEKWLRTVLTSYGNARYEEGVKTERERVMEWATKHSGSLIYYEDIIDFLSDNQ